FSSEVWSVMSVCPVAVLILTLGTMGFDACRPYAAPAQARAQAASMRNGASLFMATASFRGGWARAQRNGFVAFCIRNAWESRAIYSVLPVQSCKRVD